MVSSSRLRLTLLSHRSPVQAAALGLQPPGAPAHPPSVWVSLLPSQAEAPRADLSAANRTCESGFPPTLLASRSASVDCPWLRRPSTRTGPRPPWFPVLCARVSEWSGVSVCLIASPGGFLNLPSLLLRTNQCFKWNTGVTVCLCLLHLVLGGFNDFLSTNVGMLTHQSASS